jgi:2-oxo-4-hydroxy-4-carboxy--5-ureidoimidazoline (OHCU) decarboxylase
MYVVKKNQKENKNKQTKRKQTKKINKKKLQKKFIRQFGSVFNKKKWLNP